MLVYLSPIDNYFLSKIKINYTAISFTSDVRLFYSS